MIVLARRSDEHLWQSIDPTRAALLMDGGWQVITVEESVAPWDAATANENVARMVQAIGEPPWTLYPHGAEREWSTDVHDEWKRPMGVRVVPERAGGRS